MAATATLIGGLLLALLLVFAHTWKNSSRRYNLPPGPRPLPLFGNLFDMPMKQTWLTVSRWAKTYGDVVYARILGVNFVFLNTADAAFDLLDKGGARYSDRPPMVMTGELCGLANLTAFAPYGDKLRRGRRLMQHVVGPSNIPSYEPRVEAHTHDFIKAMLNDPEANANFTDYIRRFTGAMSLELVYGHKAVSSDDEYLVLMEQNIDIMANELIRTGRVWPVDVLPFLKHVPSWLPGASFKRNAAVWKKQFARVVDELYQLYKHKKESGSAEECFCSTLLAKKHTTTDEETDMDIKWSMHTVYAASLDTMVTSLTMFILAMVLHPEAMSKAQAEIDSVVGTSRLPTLKDRPSLPYVNCVMSESLRWGVALPMGLPHRLTEDDVYKNMYIPKGSLVFANIWAISRDEKVYPRADYFLPERFGDFTDSERRKYDPRNYIFGFGRRRCPGNHLAEPAMWLMMACMLATLDMRKLRDEYGRTVEPEVVFDHSILRIPNPFSCDIQPRRSVVSELADFV